MISTSFASPVSHSPIEPGFAMTVAYDRQRYMTSNYQMYNQARLINQNPLSNQLEAKADLVGCCFRVSGT
jgi:hypothetical protein